MGIRLVVVDDNPHVSWEGRVYPVNATFHRFLSAFLDVPGAPVCFDRPRVPLRPATAPPADPAARPATPTSSGRPRSTGSPASCGTRGALTRRNARILGR